MTALLEFTNENKESLIGQVGGKALGCINHDKVPDGWGLGQDCFKCKLRQAVLQTLEEKKPRHMVETTMSFTGKGLRSLRISTQALGTILKQIKRMGRLNHDLMHISRYETKPYLKSKIIDIKKSSADS